MDRDVTHNFTMNGLQHANKLLGYDAFNLDDWEAVGEYKFDLDGSRHRAHVRPTRDVIVDGVHIREGERVRIEESYKYAKFDAENLFKLSAAETTSGTCGSVIDGAYFSNEVGDYCKFSDYQYLIFEIITPNIRPIHIFIHIADTLQFCTY